MSETGKNFPGRSKNDILCPFFIYNTLGHCNTCIYSRKVALFPCSPNINLQCSLVPKNPWETLLNGLTIGFITLVSLMPDDFIYQEEGTALIGLIFIEQ
jgi:hypothetical protein